MKQTVGSEQAIVLGGSMAGLLTARVLSNHFAQVTILERDAVHDRPESRKGQPHTRHLHGLLGGGFQIFNHYFPDLVETLAQSDIFFGDMGENMNWYTHGGYRRPVHTGLYGATMSRPFLEYQVRQRVLALPNVTLWDNCAVKQLLTSPGGQQVRGVLLEKRGEDGANTSLDADLVVDCTGRGSRTPQWLKELGYEAPPESEVKVDIGYASRLYRRDPHDPRGQQWTLFTPDAPGETRFAGIFPIEDGRWIISMGGWGGDHCPGDEAGFLAFARSLPALDIYNIISKAEPLSDIIAHKMPSSLRRHYEKMARFPQGLLVLGDAVSSFNPTYGQGMTSAAMQARELDQLLAKRPSLQKLAPAFFKRAAKVVDIPWQMAVGEDFRFATTTGPKPPGTDFINRYVAKVNRASHHDAVVSAAFLQVMNLLAPPTSLFHPGVLWRVLRGGKTAAAAPTYQPVQSITQTGHHV
ncbi:MAG: FAD-binding monooxygenase [Anaerolineaceae bacterium]|nr:FAD-binding monooxygenase [Anaerolineaceae bacterium]